MHQILLALQVLVAVALIAIILLQHGRGADAGAAFGSGGAGTVFGARGPATLLTRITAALAAVFFINSVALAYLARQQSLETRSVLERFQSEQQTDLPPGGVPAPGQPLEPGGGGAASDVPSLPEPPPGGGGN